MPEPAVTELTTEHRLRQACHDDTLIMWAARGFTTGARAWTHGAATAVASPGLSGRDRLAVHGPAADAEPLLRHALATAGPTYRPLGDTRLITALADRIPRLETLGTFGWMDTTTPPPPAAAVPADTDAEAEAHWLADHELPEAAALLDDHFPTSHAHPHRDGPHTWAGVRDRRGHLTAIAADAWSAPTVGLLAGVATHPDHGRGRGHAHTVCRFVLDAQLRAHGRAALMVDRDNTPAIRLYQRLGLTWRSLTAARQR
ncbi:GNAT family N-acetyltransferase [Kitasatospora cinereorecta]|uniref:GNAT family N-acetyltransferase n=1 Tax=Kitasatospora cinereorecta TaxID=285560 RepID=A0ABW0V6T3_9ACTN